MNDSKHRKDRHRRARDLFLSANRLPPRERVAFLNEACGDDVELRGEIETLLEHLDGPIGEPVGLPIGSPLAPSPASLGPYRIVRKLGEGGMGEVYEASQEQPVRRTVALKVIKSGMDTKQVVARFAAERQALALMNHPNIARVFDAGSTDEGRPYFAMEYVAGVPITEYCDARRLPVQARLELFQQVCAGVQHAHRAGVIHRDLKPSNILVADISGAASPKIIDFGIAKATSRSLTEHTLHTEIGQLVGTPDYMSPEQLEPDAGGIDTRTDVYSLGAVLYELLAGAPPFDTETLRAGGFDTLRRTIKEIDPVPPSSRFDTSPRPAALAADRGTDAAGLRRALRGDLDWIVAKALEKDRVRRYGTPAELAADIDRHLRDEPVVAGPPSRRYRAGKFVRRHRIGVTAGSVVLLALVAGAGLALAGFLRAVEAEQAALQEAQVAEQISDFLLGMFRGFDPRSFRERTPTALDVLARTAERIDEELQDQPAMRAQLQAAVGGIYAELGFYEEARPLLESALAARRNALATHDPAIAMSVADMAWLEYNTGDFHASLSLLEEALELRRSAVGPEHIDVAPYLSMLGSVLWRLGRLESAMDFLQRAGAIRERDLGPDHMDVINTRYEQSLVQIDLGDWAAARANLERAVEARTALTGPDNLGVASAAFELGLLLVGMNEREAGEAQLQHALRVRESALGPDHPDVARLLQSIGGLRLDEGEYGAAWGLFERAARILEDSLGPDHPAVASSIGRRAGFYMRIGELERAHSLYEDALEISESALGSDHPQVGSLLIDLARAFRRAGDPQTARSLLQRAVAISENAAGPDSIMVAGALHGMGSALRDSGEHEDARAYYDRALAIRQRVMGPDHPAVASVLFNRATLHALVGELDEARDLFERALEVRLASLPAEHLDLAESLEGLGGLLDGTGNADRARDLLARARSIRDKHRRAIAALER